jgi:hypothetical protein
MKKFSFLLFVCFTLLINVTNVTGQDKLVKKVTESIEKLNTQLKSVNPALALSDEQVKLATAIYSEGENKMAEARKNASTDEDKKEAQKPIRQEMNKRIRQEVLSKEQKQALNELSAKKEKP